MTPLRRILLAALVSLAACGGFGKVNQGRVIEYDPVKGLITLVSEPGEQEAVAATQGILPPVTIQVPDDPRQMGPHPQAGKLMELDTANRRAVIFDAAAQSFKSVEFTLEELRERVFAGDPALQGDSFPKIDRARKVITLYSPERHQLIAFKVADEYLAMPLDTWITGDQVRYYYKDPHKALRLMNVTRTGI